MENYDDDGVPIHVPFTWQTPNPEDPIIFCPCSWPTSLMPVRTQPPSRSTTGEQTGHNHNSFAEGWTELPEMSAAWPDFELISREKVATILTGVRPAAVHRTIQANSSTDLLK